MNTNHKFSTDSQRPLPNKRDPERLETITGNIARCVGEMIRYPQSFNSARYELAESLDDYARYIITKCRKGSES